MGKPHHLLRSVLEFPWEGLSDVVIVIIGLKKWKLSHGSAVWKSEIKVWIGHAPSETCGGILSGLFLVWGGGMPVVSGVPCVVNPILLLF